jgi:hypothetical protein
MRRCPKAKPGKQRRAHDEKRSKKRSAAWEAFVGSFTSIDPNLTKRTERFLELVRRSGASLNPGVDLVTDEEYEAANQP